jgi:hypothetical protein
MYLVNAARQRARAFGREFDLDVDMVRQAIERGTCAVTGLPFVLLRPTGSKHDKKQHPLAPSIDRVDCSRGYTHDNVRVVAWAVNIGAQTFGLDVYLAIAARALGVSNPFTDATIARLQGTST